MKINRLLRSAVLLVGLSSFVHAAPAADPAYFTQAESMRLTRDADGILVVEMHDDGGPITFTATDHEQFTDIFYEIARDRDNKVVILTGAGGEWISSVDFQSFGNVGDANVWAKTIDEGTQILENITNVRALMICAVEGRAWVHSEYCLLANYIIAGEGATFSDAPHFAGGIVPGDGIYTTWSFHAGSLRAQAFLLNAEPISAETAREWGVVSEVVNDGKTLERAKELARSWATKTDLTRRNTRTHFIRPLKERIVQEVNYGLTAEGESVDALVKSLSTRSQE